VKILPGLVLLAVLAVAGSGCDVAAPAATVDGVAITQSQLDAQLTDVVGDQYAACVLELQGTNLPSSLTGAGGSTVSSQFASSELSSLVLEDLISQDLARHHHEVTASQTEAAKQDLDAQLGSAISQSSSPCPVQLTGAQLLSRVPAAFAAEQVRYLADEEQLAVAVAHVDLSTTSLERYYRANPSQFAEICLSDIAVTSQSDAQLILGAIDSGSETFAAAARQSSIDTSTAQNGGVIPCVASSEVQNSSLLSAISGLSVGQVSQPVEETSSTGTTLWLLLEVDARPELPFAQVRSQIRESLLSAQDSKLSAEFDQLASHADVSVDPRYGTWARLQGVRPPVAPSAKDVLAPAADGGASSPVLGG